MPFSCLEHIIAQLSQKCFKKRSTFFYTPAFFPLCLTFILNIRKSPVLRAFFVQLQCILPDSFPSESSFLFPVCSRQTMSKPVRQKFGNQGIKSKHLYPLRFLSIILQYTIATNVLTAVATIPGPTIAVGFTLPYWLRYDCVKLRLKNSLFFCNLSFNSILLRKNPGCFYMQPGLF